MAASYQGWKKTALQPFDHLQYSDDAVYGGATPAWTEIGGYDIAGDASAGNVCGRPYAESPILVLLSNTADSRCTGIEHNPVRLFLAENLPEDVQDNVRRRIAATQEIEVARASKGLFEPCHQQHGAFQNETGRGGIARDGKAGARSHSA